MSLNRGRQKRSSGFTIVEVMIVLAVAAFILIIVFLAVPALRKSARNNARQTDVKLMLARVQEEVSHTGRFPLSCNAGDSACFLSDVKLSQYEEGSSDLTWEKRNAAVTGNLLNPADSNDTAKVVMTNFAKCNANNVTGTGATQYDSVATYLIETMGGHDVACIQS